MTAREQDNFKPRASLVLASASKSRRDMLQKAGIDCLFEAADIDETRIKNKLAAEGTSVKKISEQLALDKALVVSAHHPGKVILGADQLLECQGRLFDKPRNRAEAEEHLRFFRGKSHRLYTSYVFVQNGQTLAAETVIPELTMRDFSESFLADYMEKSGARILGSVGCYLLEDLGLQLFSKIDGDYFAILGLPLLKVMQKLRDLNILRS